MDRRIHCPHCQRRVGVSGWGVIRKHRTEPNGDRCPQSGQLAPGFEWLEAS